ncbi:unnamed protein product [Lepidochelys kempii]
MPAATLGQAVLAPQPWGLGTAPHSPGQDAAAIMHRGSECHKGQVPPSAAPGHGASTDCQVRAPLLSPHLLPAAQRPLALHRGQPCQVRAPPAGPCRPRVGGVESFPLQSHMLLLPNLLLINPSQSGPTPQHSMCRVNYY